MPKQSEPPIKIDTKLTKAALVTELNLSLKRCENLKILAEENRQKLAKYQKIADASKAIVRELDNKLAIHKIAIVVLFLLGVIGWWV